MKMILNNKKCASLSHIVTIFFVLLILLGPSPLRSNVNGADALNGNDVTPPPVLELRVDANKHARAFCNGMKAIVSIGNFFEFFDRSLIEGRKRIFKGPWNGSLREESPDKYTLKGIDPETGIKYSIVFKQIDPSTIELFMTFKSPSRSSNIGFDIIKLSGDLFKGASIEANPASAIDKGAIPIDPLPIGKHMLLTNKNRILLKSALCDLEIKDLMESKSILAADFRNIPWDAFRSIYFGGEKYNLLPDRVYSFKYSIRCLSPSNSFVPKVLLAPDSLTIKIEDQSLTCLRDSKSAYSLPPKEEIKGTGHYELLPQDVIYGSPSGTAEKILAKGIRDTTSMPLEIKPVESAKTSRGIFIEKTLQGNASNLPPEGFEIISSPEKVVIRGMDARACLYGVYSLMGRLSQYESGKWHICSGTIRDWPDLPVRGVCTELLSPAIRDVDFMKRYLDAFSRARSNVVIFLHYPRQVLAWLKDVDDGGWTRNQMVEIVQHARSLHMDVWGGMVSRFNSTDFPGMDIYNGSNLYNPLNENSYEHLFPLYEEILQTYHPTTLVVCHDEIQGLSLYAAESDKSSADILAMGVGRIHNWLKQRNVQTAMWGDMLLDFEKWDGKAGGANSRNPYFNSGSTHEALENLPDDVFILDWHYDYKDSYGSIDYFRRNGFRVNGASWHDPKAARSMVQSVKKYGGQGIFATDWGFWRTLSPAATTFYAPLCGWSSKCLMDQSNNDVVTLAEMLKEDIYIQDTFDQIPVNLAIFSNESTMDLFGRSGNGLFGVGPILNLREIPLGKQLLGGISFDIASGDNGRADNCIVVVNSDHKNLSLPKEKDIFQGDMKAKAIAFLHTCFVEEPQMRVRKIGRYEVEYENGHMEIVNLLENWNITDVRSSEGLRYNPWSFLRSPEVLIGSNLAWKGSCGTGIPLNLQVFIWKNPYQDQTIRRIRLSGATSPLNSRLVLVGLTCLQ